VLLARPELRPQMISATEREMGERMTALFLQGADVVTPIAETWAAVGFHNASGDVKFTTFVRPILRGAPGSGAL